MTYESKPGQHPGQESFAAREIKERPEKLYRSFTVNPEELTMETLRGTLVPGTVSKDDPTKIGDGNELGVYMSTNPHMVEAAYAKGGGGSIHIEVPKYHDGYTIVNHIKLPSCGIMVEVDTAGLEIRPPNCCRRI